MNVKSILENVSNFIISRLIQLIGIILAICSVMLFLALITYSAEDPNFIYSNNNEINNALGFYGSIVSDLFLQSMGLVSFMFVVTLFLPV